MAKGSVQEETRAGDPFVWAAERKANGIDLALAVLGDEDEEAFDEVGVARWLKER